MKKHPKRIVINVGIPFDHPIIINSEEEAGNAKALIAGSDKPEKRLVADPAQETPPFPADSPR